MNFFKASISNEHTLSRFLVWYEDPRPRTKGLAALWHFLRRLVQRMSQKYDDGEISTPWLSIVLYIAAVFSCLIGLGSLLDPLANRGPDLQFQIAISEFVASILTVGAAKIISLLNEINVRIMWAARKPFALAPGYESGQQGGIQKLDENYKVGGS